MFRRLFVATSYPALSLAFLVTLMPAFNQHQTAYSSTNTVSQKKRRRLARQSGERKRHKH
ncbi:MAG TPA: hypothetical protein VF803_03965 [Candidatus Paceibacterota bacterium]